MRLWVAGSVVAALVFVVSPAQSVAWAAAPDVTPQKSGENAASAAAMSATAVNPSSTDRLAGADRYATSALISAQYAPGVPSVYIATGAAFPDALAAGAAAGTGSPVLLVAGGVVPPAVSAEVARLHPGRIILVGGRNAVPDSVGSALALSATNGWVRISGADRYTTAAAVSSSTFRAGLPVAYLASGVAFPDALTGSALGALNGNPVLLTGPNALPAATIAELTRLAPRSIVVLGGATAISDAVVSEARAYSPTVTRVQGADRYATNVAADAVVPSPTDTIVLAAGTNFPDALSGAALAGHLHTAMMLVGPGLLSDAQKALIGRLAPTHVDVLGGPSAISDQTLNQVLTAAGLPLVGPSTPVAGDYALNYATGLAGKGPQVVRWNPCRTIGWRLNSAGLDSTLLNTINAEVAQLAAATGLTFRYDGVTTFVPTTTNADNEPDDLIVAVIAKSVTDLFNDNTQAIGVGGWADATTAAGNWQITNAYAVLDQGTVAALPEGVQSGANTGTLLLHELGHAVGLAHAASPVEIMYPAINNLTPQTYSAQDRLGLTAVGSGGGCIT